MLLNFGWVRKAALAGMGFPDPDAWPLLVAEGIRAVLTLTESAPRGDPRAAGLDTLHVPIPDFGTPSDADLRRCMRWIREHVEAGRPVVVHCRAGQGRTGMILAAYLVEEGLSADEAIGRVRTLRPGSIETTAQLKAVKRRARALRRQRKAGSGGEGR